MKRIIVKTIPAYFQLVWTGKKYSELRFDDDKDYRIGDILIQKEWSPKLRKFTGREIEMIISAITRVNHFIDCDHCWVILHLNPDTFYRCKY